MKRIRPVEVQSCSQTQRDEVVEKISASNIVK